MRISLKSLFTGIEKEAWIRFFVALGGLALAFAAALFSTVARQSGNLFATALFASSALLIAGVVAITTVPYLARRVALARVRDAFDYDVTREGLGYFALTLAIAVAALNTGNNLLFLVVSAMLAAVVVSGVASAGLLRGLELQVSLPEHVFAGRTVLGRFTLRNHRRVLPAFSVSVVRPKQSGRRKQWRWERTLFAFPPKRPPERQWVRVPDLALRRATPQEPRPPIFSGSVYFPYVPRNAAAGADVELKFERRGLYVQDDLGLSTRFPFSFLNKTRRIRLQAEETRRASGGATPGRELLVYPSVEPTDDLFEVLPMITGEFEAFTRGRGYDLYRIREYMPEDSARHVDWKATAKSGALKVREFTREDERKLRIVFDNPAPGAVFERAYEGAVALAASLAWHFAGENTELSFAAPGYSGAGDVFEFFRYLALVEPRAEESVIERLQVTDDYNVILTTRPRGSIPTALWTCSYFIFIENRD
jgi:uncharacterized protein (DUF58 family)